MPNKTPQYFPQRPFFVIAAQIDRIPVIYIITHLDMIWLSITLPSAKIALYYSVKQGRALEILCLVILLLLDDVIF